MTLIMLSRMWSDWLTHKIIIFLVCDFSNSPSFIANEKIIDTYLKQVSSALSVYPILGMSSLTHIEYLIVEHLSYDFNDI